MENKSLTSPIINERKAEALDFIFENALKSGFGTLSKTELDAILFAAIMEYGDQSSTADLELSKYLRITQRRVQSLKENVSVKYKQLDQKEAIKFFVSRLEYAKKDEKYIDIPINNVAVRNEIEGMLDEYNILLHLQLNSKIFRVRIDDLLDLLLIIQAKYSDGETYDDLKNTVIESIINSEGKIKGLDDSLDYQNKQKIIPDFKKMILKSGIDIALSVMKETIPFGGVAADIIKKLMDNFGILQNV